MMLLKLHPRNWYVRLLSAVVCPADELCQLPLRDRAAADAEASTTVARLTGLEWTKSQRDASFASNQAGLRGQIEELDSRIRQESARATLVAERMQAQREAADSQRRQQVAQHVADAEALILRAGQAALHEADFGEATRLYCQVRLCCCGSCGRLMIQGGADGAVPLCACGRLWMRSHVLLRESALQLLAHIRRPDCGDLDGSPFGLHVACCMLHVRFSVWAQARRGSFHECNFNAC